MNTKHNLREKKGQKKSDFSKAKIWFVVGWENCTQKDDAKRKRGEVSFLGIWT